MTSPLMAILVRNWKKVAAVLAFFLFGMFLGVSFSVNLSGLFSRSTACPADLKFVRAEQDCESFLSTADKIDNLQDDLKQEVNVYLNTNRADRISVFVRDLDSQRFALVNGDQEFYMASLLKVPLAIAYYRLAQLTPDLLDQKVVYNGKPDLYALQDIQPPAKLAVGTTYTIKDLIYRALAYSDNTAAQLLSQNYVSDEYLQKLLFTLGLQPRAKDQQENLVTARTYAGIFRTLYYSSFLSREYSNEILKALSESTFTAGATAKLPSDVPVAHKFGEREVDDPYTGTVSTRQLHDCGIVYAAGDQAYSFCIMTDGKDFSELESIIQNLSATIYTEITG